jgi:hypothetical protein
MARWEEQQESYETRIKRIVAQGVLRGNNLLKVLGTYKHIRRIADDFGMAPEDVANDVKRRVAELLGRLANR